MKQTVGWLRTLLQECNGAPDLELEAKFAPKFQGIVPEDFLVGVDAQTFRTVMNHFEEAVTQGALTISHSNETVHFLSDSAYDMCGEQLNQCGLINKHGSDVRVVIQPDKPRSVLIKTRLELPGAKKSVYVEGFKLSLSNERFIEVESRDALQVIKTFDALPPGAIMARRKQRTSFTQRVLDKDHNSIEILRFDFTVTHTDYAESGDGLETDDDPNTDDGADRAFEIEMEYVGNKNPRGGTASLQQSPQMMEKVATLFFNNIRRLLCLIQGSSSPINIKQHNQLVCAYMEVLGVTGADDPYRPYKFETTDTNLFKGCQPRSLHKRDLPLLVQDGYFVMDKTDGERFQLLALPSEGMLRCYLIDRWMHIVQAGLTVTSPDPTDENNLIASGFLLDGELVSVEGDAPDRYLAFDVLWASGVDLRPKLTYRRLENLAQIVKEVNAAKQVGKAALHVEIKHYVHWPRGKALSGDLIREMTNRDYAVDSSGSKLPSLIFTPDMPYPRTRKWPQLLKWKGKQSTVDLFVKRNDKEGRWDLLLCGSFATIRRDQTRCLVFKQVPAEDAVFGNRGGGGGGNMDKPNAYWVVMANGLIVQHPSRDLMWSDTRSSIPFPFQPWLNDDDVAGAGIELEDEAVFEFSYDSDAGKLVPLCKRSDKSLQGVQGANDLRVAVDVWESMKYPVTQAQLLALPKIEADEVNNERSYGTYPHVQDIHRGLDWQSVFSGKTTTSDARDPSLRELIALRRMHNRIKGQVIERATCQTKTVTDAEMLTSLGGQVISSRDATTGYNVTSPKWSLPKTPHVWKMLETVWGVQKEDCTGTAERIHVTERALRQRQSTLTIQDEAKVVVDMCCGKGGDLNKYVKQNVGVLVGIDNVPELLHGYEDAALNRWSGLRMRRVPPQTDACFVLADARQPIYDTLSKLHIPLEADVVTCFFAIHYFFSTEQDAKSLLQNVKDLLKPGGFFVGTVIDGELMHDKLRQNDNCYHWEPPDGLLDLFEVKSVNFDATQKSFEELPSYGTRIDVTIQSSIIEQYFNLPEKDGSSKSENLVKFDVLVRLASDYDLALVETQTFDQYFPEFPSIQLPQAVASYSATHRTFCFRKVSKSRDDGLRTSLEIKENVRRLQQQQLHEGKVADTVEPDVYACHAAYPDDAIIRRLPSTATFNDDYDEEDDVFGEVAGPVPQIVAKEEEIEEEEEEGEDGPQPMSLDSGDEEEDEKEEQHEEDEEDDEEGAESSSEEEAPSSSAKRESPPRPPTPKAKKKAKIVPPPPPKKKEAVVEPVTKKAKKDDAVEEKLCGARCANGECRGCACKRKFKQKCHAGCGCGKLCRNR